MAKRAKPKPDSQPPKRMKGALSEADHARIWSLREEDKTYREIRSITGHGYEAIARVLKSDPEKIEALAREQTEHKQRRWEQVEGRALDLVGKILTEAERMLFTPTGQRRRGVKTQQIAEWYERSKPVLAQARLIAEGAGRRSLDLRPRIQTAIGTVYAEGSSVDGGGPGGAAFDDWTDDDFIREALRIGMVEQLPARMRERMAKLVDEGLAGQVLGDEWEDPAIEAVQLEREGKKR